LKKDGLVTILQDGIEGITGVKGKSTATAPLAAASFVEGILSNSSVPDGLSYPGFAVDILKRVKSNANVDELVSYQVALADSPSDLTTLATTLYKSYAADDVKITQGLLAATPPTSGTSEAARAADVSSLTTASIKNAAAIVQGAVFVDPHHTQDFTEASLDAINTFGGEKLVDSDAPTIAKDLGNTLGQDGDALTGVAEVFSELTGSGDLEVSRVATVATDLISGAVKSKVPASEFTGGAAGYGGGTLNVLNPVQETGSDLAGVLDLLATGIIAADSSVLDTPKGQKAVAAELGTLAEDIARFVKSEDFGSGPNTSVAVAAYLAGSLASTVNSLLENSEPVAVMDIDADIIKDVDAVVSKTVRPSVQQAVDSDSYASVGDIALPETTVTNL
jgi:hypothetical protein